MFIESYTPAILLMTNEWGPATFTTTGASTLVPSARVIPATRLPFRRTSTTSVLNRNTPPWASVARCKLWVAN